MSKSLFLILGNQLFPVKFLETNKSSLIVMIEHRELATYFKFHKHKIAFFFSSMRHYAEELKSAGLQVEYWTINDTREFKSYADVLKSSIEKNKIKTLVNFEIEDHFFKNTIDQFILENGLESEIIRSPLFLVTQDEFRNYLGTVKRPFMKTFYERQRKSFSVLMTDGTPTGGQYSFDEDNRQKWPEKNLKFEVKKFPLDAIDLAVFKDVNQYFADHVGDLNTFWHPTTRAQAKARLNEFFQERFLDFGPYEDAMTPNNEIVHHSTISAAMNVGLLLPADIIKGALRAADQEKIPLNSLEGFIRQILGWREFIRGIYHNFDDQMQTTNFFNHNRKMNQNWYIGKTGVPPLDDTIKKTLKLAWSHHIERLMILANIMNLSQLHPQNVYSWFMEMYADSSDWVMSANVFGMGLHSDGGIFATKPYICGSNYILKMSSYSSGPWCEELDGLYWQFIANNKNFFSSNPRLSMMTRTYEKIKSERKEALHRASHAFLNRNTITN